MLCKNSKFYLTLCSHLKTSGVSGPKARPPTVPSSFSLRCEERAAKRKEFFQKLEEKTNAKILVSGRRIADGKSHGIDHLKTLGVSGPKARPPTVPSSFSLRCEERAAKRKEFFQKLEEKTNAKILVSGRRIADGKSHGIDHLKTLGVSGPKARPPTVPSSFSLRCEERAAKRKEFFQKLEEKTNAKILVSGRRIADGKSHGIDHLKTLGVSGPKARPPTVPSSFSLRCEERAAKRKEFFQKLEEKTNAKEANKVYLQAKNKAISRPIF
ncbi:protein WVD2-like 5 [Camellia sinensis]|uniref:protein WVD2-like 5 n=1 Tax=Camellia sinensis TaxID=4442 RepID=UPI0010360AB0|nr:protein WVD2-like 5 [Camellia sinensis]